MRRQVLPRGWTPAAPQTVGVALRMGVSGSPRTDGYSIIGVSSLTSSQTFAYTTRNGRWLAGVVERPNEVSPLENGWVANLRGIIVAGIVALCVTEGGVPSESLQAAPAVWADLASALVRRMVRSMSGT
jgi:hypothetical protein